MICLPEKIETQRLVLERLQFQDAEAVFYTYASKPEATRFMAWPTHESMKDTREFLQHAYTGWVNGSNFSYAIRTRQDYRFRGSIGCINEEGKIQIGYVLGPLHWGKGYATEATLALIGELKKQEGVFRIGSFVDAENKASVQVLKKAGMVEEAFLEKWFRFINQDNAPKDCILFRLPS